MTDRQLTKRQNLAWAIGRLSRARNSPNGVLMLRNVLLVQFIFSLVGGVVSQKEMAAVALTPAVLK